VGHEKTPVSSNWLYCSK